MAGLSFGYYRVTNGETKPFRVVFFDIVPSYFLQGWVMCSILVGCFIGALGSVCLTNRVGRKIPLIAAAALVGQVAIDTVAANHFCITQIKNLFIFNKP